MLVVGCAQVSTVNAASLFELNENIMVDVFCDTATGYVLSSVQSDNASKVHFPSGVDMNDPDLENVTGIALSFSTLSSTLGYVFNNTDSATARSIADAFTTDMSTAFSTSFTYSSTGINDSVVTVAYTAAGKGNLTEYTEGLMSQCLISGIEGFSLALLPTTSKPGATTMVSAIRWGSTWLYSMQTKYDISIPTGPGSHTIDVLDLLDVSSLAPSPYAPRFMGSYMMSAVNIAIHGTETVTYISSEPGLAGGMFERGWTFTEGIYATAYFYFGNDSSPVSPLTLTFGTTVIPEFPSMLILPLFIIATLLVVTLYKRKQSA